MPVSIDVGANGVRIENSCSNTGALCGAEKAGTGSDDDDANSQQLCIFQCSRTLSKSTHIADHRPIYDFAHTHVRTASKRLLTPNVWPRECPRFSASPTWCPRSGRSSSLAAFWACASNAVRWDVMRVICWRFRDDDDDDDEHKPRMKFVEKP